MIRLNIRLTKGYFISLSAILALSAMNASLPSAVAQTTTLPALKQENSQVLSQLEEKLFEHDYHSDDDNARLKRLEDFVYGSSQSGSFQSRLANLQAVASAFKAAKKTIPSNTTAQSTENGSTLPAKSTQHPSFDYANYPRVAQLEKLLLGSTYANDALPDRLARLETKAFGHPSTASDLCERVDLLDQYADRHDLYHERGAADQVNSLSPLAIAARSMAAAENPFVAGENEPTNAEDRISAMEELVFGHSYTSRSKEERLARLEKRLVPWEHNLAQKDTKSRVDNLWNMLKVANTMNSSPLSKGSKNLVASNPPTPAASYDSHDATSESTGAPAGSSGSHQSWLHSLGRSLAGGQPGNMNSAYPYSGSYGYPGAPGMGFGGMGMGGMGYGGPALWP